jgi:hypothetical protein
MLMEMRVQLHASTETVAIDGHIAKGTAVYSQ